MAERARLILICGLPGSGKTTEAIRLATGTGGIRLCPDDWMTALGFDLWDADARVRVESLQWELARRLLEVGHTVIIEWGLWSRSEREQLRVGAHEVGAIVELRYLEASVEVLWERLRVRQANGAWPARPITRSELDGWVELFEAPTEAELGAYDTSSRTCS